MPDLEQRLAQMRDEVAWPATPALADGVVARVERGERPRPAQPPQPRAARWRGRRLVLAVALALLVPAGAAFAFPEARDDVLRWLGVKGAEVRREPRLPPATQPSLADLGDLVTLEAAEKRAGFRPLVPAALGDPGDVRHDAATNFVTFVYAGPLLVAQVDGALDRQLVMKLVNPRTGVREVDVDGDHGLFIEGPRHVYLYVRPDGSVVEAEPRLAGNTLLFSRGDRLFRIEAARLTLERALAIARSLR